MSKVKRDAGRELKSSIKIREISFRIHVHATESLEKIRDGLKFLLSDDITEFEPSEIKITHVMSIFHTPIRIIEVSIVKQPRIKSILKRLSSLMSDELKEELNRDFALRLNDKKQFFFRIDKQSLLMKKIKLATGSDIVQIILSPVNKNPKAPFEVDDIRNFFKRLNII